MDGGWQGIDSVWIAAVMLYAVWNIIVFSMYGWDKRKAKQDKRRTSERTLLFTAALMGALGAFCGMRLFRHKTKHLKFVIGVPLLLLLNVLAILLVYLISSEIRVEASRYFRALM